MKSSLTVRILSLVFLLSSIIACNQDVPEEFTIVDGGGDSTTVNTQIEILNQAGEFYNFNLRLMDGINPVAGANVILSSTINGSVREIEASSDASGNVVFSSIIVGGNIMTIEADGYVPITGVIDFRFEEGFNYQVVENEVIPIERNESMIIPLFGENNEDILAIVRGNVFVDTDLTNTIQEVPEGLEIKANFNNNDDVISSEGVSLMEYTFIGNGNLGRAIVQPDGSYEIRVPVNNNGSPVSLMFPQLQMNQRLAINGDRNDEEALEGPQIVEIQAIFGPEEQVDFIPEVAGVSIEFPEPPAAGAGFQITGFERAGRELLIGRFSGNTIFPSVQEQNMSSIRFVMTQGSNFQATPTLVVTDETGTGFDTRVNLEVAVAGITIENEGLYSANRFISASIQYLNNGVNVGTFSTNRSFGFAVDENGRVTQELINDEIERILASNSFNTRRGFGTNFENADFVFDEVIVIFDDPFMTNGVTATASVRINSRIGNVNILNGGNGYINPTLTFEGGNPDNNAIFEIISFATRWGFSLDNSQINSPYDIVPGINFEYLTESNFFTTSSTVINLSTGVSRPIIDFLTTNDEGQVVFSRNDVELVTDFFSLSMPEAIVFENVSRKARALANIDQNGGISLVSVIDRGMGYTDRFDITVVPAIEGLPGTGAKLRISGGEFRGGQFRWDNGFISVTSRGNGYVSNVNRVPRSGFTTDGPIELILSPGDVVLRNISYGTGRRGGDLF